MQSKELMIGDWVATKDYKFQVTSVAKASVRTNYLNRVYNIAEKELQPIPLTLEILEKNNLPIDRVAWWYADDFEDADDRITYEIHISGEVISVNGFVWYVHELQHALRLCGLNALADDFKV